MRLVVVSLPNSIHSVRVLGLLDGLGWELHVVPATYDSWHEDLLGRDDLVLHEPVDVARPDALERALAEVVDAVGPDIVHTHQMTFAGRAHLWARSHMRGPLPRWIVSNWGSDLYLFGREPQMRQELRRVLVTADAYWAECHRDVGLAWAEGFRGRVLPVVPITGGFDLVHTSSLRSPGPTSARRSIAVKGYTHWVARNELALDGLLRNHDLLDGYTVEVYAATPDSLTERMRSFDRAGVDAIVHPRLPYDDILRLHGRSRTSIGISRSDGTSTAFLEALVAGSFPIQTDTSCAGEWVRSGTSALLVDHRRVWTIDDAIRRVLTDDELVDRAVALNDARVRTHLDTTTIRQQVVDAYVDVLERSPRRELAR